MARKIQMKRWTIETGDNDNASVAVANLLIALDVRVNQTTIERCLELHYASDPDSGCRSILSQPIARPFGIFSLSEIGLAYSLSGLLILFFSLQGTAPEAVSVALLLAGVLALPAIAYLTFYQFAVGQWCKLCVLFHALVGFEIVLATSYVLSNAVPVPQWQDWLLIVTGVVCVVGVWLVANVAAEDYANRT